MDLDITIGGYSCAEDDKNYSIDYSETSSATRRLRCNWSDAAGLAKYLRGYVESVNGIMVVHGQQPHPDANWSWLYVDDVKITPVGKATGVGTFQFAQLDVTYKAIPYANNSTNATDLEEINISVAGEIVSLEKDFWKFSGGDPLQDPPQKMIVYAEIDITKYRQTTSPVSTMAGLFGKLNSNSIRIRGYTFPAFTVLYAGGSVKEQITNAGLTRTVTHKLMAAPFDLRKRVNSKSSSGTVAGMYEFVQSKNGSAYLYDSADFTALISSLNN